VSQKKTTEQKVAVVVGIKRVLSNSKLADANTLVEVCHRLELKNCILDVEANRRQQLSKAGAISTALTESFVRLAV